MWSGAAATQYVVSPYGALLRFQGRRMRDPCRRRERRQNCRSSFLRKRFRFRRRGVIVGSTDPERIHPIFEHAAADAELGRGMRLDIIILLERVENDLALEFHHRFFERETARER